MHALYQGLSQRIVQGSQEKSTCIQWIIYINILPLHIFPPPPVITWLERAINWKPVPGQQSTSTKCNLYELLTPGAYDMVTWYWSADTLFWQLSITTDVQCEKCTHGNGAWLGVRTYIWMHVWTVTWQLKLLRLMGYQENNVLRYERCLLSFNRSSAILNNSLLAQIP